MADTDTGEGFQLALVGLNGLRSACLRRRELRIEDVKKDDEDVRVDAVVPSKVIVVCICQPSGRYPLDRSSAPGTLDTSHRRAARL